VYEQIEEFSAPSPGLVLLYQHIVLGIIPNKKPAQAFLH
jgi:hypothetical protein